MFADTVLFWFHFECFVSVFFIESQTAGTEEQSPAAAGTQAPRLLEVLGRCSSQSGPSHRQLRRSTQQREDVLGTQGQGLGASTACPPSCLPPKHPCLDSAGAALTLVSLHARQYSSYP